MIREITLPIPPTLNEQIDLARSHWSKSSKMKKHWTARLSKMMRKTPAFEGKVWQSFEWYVSSFANDWDNVVASVKYINDAFSEAGVLKNDNLMVIQSPIINQFQRKIKGEDPKVIVTISDRPIFELVKLEHYLEPEDGCPLPKFS